MVPRKYIFEDADAMSDYLDDSYFNGKLLNGVLTMTNNLGYPSLSLEMLELFNEAYYIATRVLFEQYPEMDIRRNYLDYTRRSVQDDYTRDVIYAMVYVILCRLENRPEKAERFCVQLSNIFSYSAHYMEEIISVNRVCEYQGIYSDWDWTPPAVDLYEVFGTPTDWKEATDDFKLENIKSYMEHSITVDARYEVLSDIQKALHAERKKNKDAYSANLLTKVAMMLSNVKSEKDVADSIKKVKQLQTEPDPPLTLTTEFHAQNFVEGETESKEDEKDAEIARLNGIIEKNNQDLHEINETVASLNSQLDDALVQVKELTEKAALLTEEDDNDVPDERTQKVVTNYLYKILQLAGMGGKSKDFHKTDAADLIHYITGFSTNTIRTSLTYPRNASTAKKEIAAVKKLLKTVNLDISID